MTLEDLCVHRERVTGVVVNRTTISGALPVDPIVLQAGTVIDASGHEAVAVERLRARNLLASRPASAGSGEGPMDATAGEAFVVERVAEAVSGSMGDRDGRERHIWRTPHGARCLEACCCPGNGSLN